MDNPLLTKTALDVSPEEEWAKKVELIEKTDMSLMELQKRDAKIESTKKRLQIERKEQGLTNAETLTRKAARMIEKYTSDDVVDRVAENIVTPKDHKEALQAAREAADLRDKEMDGKWDDVGKSSKAHVKIIAQFQQADGSIMTSGVEIG